MSAMDFPANPAIGQQFINEIGTVYVWNGVAWLLSSEYVPPMAFPTLEAMLTQIRVTLQDTDNASTSGYRYSTDELVTNVNSGILEMFRIRPDIFLEVGLKPFAFSSTILGQNIPIEQQWVPALIYYAVGFTQLRDDEPEQDQRATMFIQKFNSMLTSVV